MAYAAWVAPTDAGSRLESESGSSLFNLFRSLPWHSFLQAHLQEVPVNNLKLLVEKIISAAPDHVSGAIDVDPASSNPETYAAALRRVYVSLEESPRDVNAIIDDLRRAWSGRSSDEVGIAAVAEALDGEFIQEARVAQLQTLARALDDISIPSLGGGLKFAERNLRKGPLMNRMLDFWKDYVPITALEGFLGRFFPANHKDREKGFKQNWSVELLDDLETSELRRLASFITNNHALSPSGSAARRLLSSILEAPVNVASTPAPVEVIEVGQGRRSGPDLPPPPPLSFPDTEELRSRPSTPAASTDEGSSSDDNAAGSGALTEVRGGARHIPSSGAVNYKTAFPSLSSKLIQILQQGGDDFARFFEPLALEVTSKKDLYALLDYFKQGSRLVELICCSSQLKVKHSRNKGAFESTPARLLRPDHRVNGQLSFPPMERVAPVELRRWIQKGSIVPFVEGLASKAGGVHKSNADAFTAREIMCTGLALAALLDEFHPNPIVYSAGVERLVRRLLVIETALNKDRKDRAGVFEKNLDFMGINSGPSASTRSALHD